MGQTIEVQGKLWPIQNRPGSSFDYAAYMAKKHIWHQSYVSQEDIHLLTSSTDFLYGIDWLRHRIQSVFYTYLQNPGLAQALILGEKTALSYQEKQWYGRVGIAHFLVVSGWHVGLICAVLLFSFRHMRLFIGKKVYEAIAVLLFLWTYICLTGGAPPTFRAGVMCSIFLLGRAFGRNTDVYNTIFLSLFIQIVLAPQALYSLSLQLSYAAVLGIVSLYPRFAMKEGSLWKKYLWNSLVLSFCAQWLTYPLLLHYFGQISLLSFLGNWVFMPLISLFIFLSILLLVSAMFSPTVAEIVGSIMDIFTLKHA